MDSCQEKVRTSQMKADIQKIDEDLEGMNIKVDNDQKNLILSISQHSEDQSLRQRLQQEQILCSTNYIRLNIKDAPSQTEERKLENFSQNSVEVKKV